jgi:hypothetical protein
MIRRAAVVALLTGPVLAAPVLAASGPVSLLLVLAVQIDAKR